MSTPSKKTQQKLNQVVKKLKNVNKRKHNTKKTCKRS